MSIITLTTDLGYKDYYVSSIKGTMLSLLPSIIIVDITHNIPKFDIMQTAFVIRNIINDFPAGTIHIIGVMSDASAETPHIVVQYKEQYFIGADNGMFSLIFDQKPDKIVELTISQDTDFLTFPTKDVFVKAACHIARGGTMELIGGPRDAILEKSMFRAVAQNNTIRGAVIYIDAYGNVITNITEQLFNSERRGRNFMISFRVTGNDITKISKSYKDVVEGERLALFGTTGYLEISINIGNASNLLGLILNDTIRVEFLD